MAQKWPLALGALVGAAALAGSLSLDVDTARQWQLAARYTARVGFFLLILTFTASSLVRLWPNGLTWALLRDRRWWGLGFAACHTIHLFALVEHARITGEAIHPVALYGGGAAFVLLYAMVLTSNNAVQRAMGRSWHWLHKVGIYYLWLIFLQSYLGKISHPATQAVGVVFSTIALAAWGLRIAAWLKKRKLLPVLG